MFLYSHSLAIFASTLFVFEFGHKLFVQPHRPPGIFCLMSYSLGWSPFELGGCHSRILTSLLGSYFPPGFHDVGLFWTDLQESQILLPWSPGLWACFLPSSLLSVSWTPPPHGHCSQGYLWPSHPQQAPPRWWVWGPVEHLFSLAHMSLGGGIYREFTSGTWIAYALHVDPPADIWVVEASHEDEGLWMSGCYCLSVEGLICSFFPIKWLILDTHYNVTFTRPLFSPNPWTCPRLLFHSQAELHLLQLLCHKWGNSPSLYFNPVFPKGPIFLTVQHSSYKSHPNSLLWSQ